MTIELQNDVREALAWRADRTSVRADIRFDGPRGDDSGEESRRPRWRLALVAAAALVLVVAGLAIIGDRRDRDVAIGDEPTTIVATAPDQDDGRLGLAPELGFVGSGAVDRALTMPRTIVTHIYASQAAEPESDGAVVVDVVPGDGTNLSSALVEGAESIPLRGQTGAFRSLSENRLEVWFHEGGFEYRLVALNLPRTTLLTLAETASLDGRGTIQLDGQLIGENVSEQSTGYMFELWFLSENALRTFVPTARFDEPSTGRYMWYVSEADPDAARLARLFYDRVTSTTVSGQPAFVGQVDTLAEYRAVVWSTGSRTVMLAGNDFSDDEMIAIAESLRTPSDAEWSAMTALTFVNTFDQSVDTTAAAGSVAETTTR